jgi:hypothetical protein
MQTFNLFEIAELINYRKYVVKVFSLEKFGDALMSSLGISSMLSGSSNFVIFSVSLARAFPTPRSRYPLTKRQPMQLLWIVPFRRLVDVRYESTSPEIPWIFGVGWACPVGTFFCMLHDKIN